VSRADEVRSQLLRLVRAVPFREFALIFDDGDRVFIKHPENIAFEPIGTEPGSDEFCVLTGRSRLFSAFGAVAGIILTDRGGAAA
jgi:hypothetical protein